MNRCRRVRRDAPFNAVRLIPDSTNLLYPFGRPSVTTVRGQETRAQRAQNAAISCAR